MRSHTFCAEKRSKTYLINCITRSWLKLCGPELRSGRPSVASRRSEALPPCRFPGSTFPFGATGKGSGMEKKKTLLRPLRPHGEGGEQSAGSPPAAVGHICGQLSPRCSLRRAVAVGDTASPKPSEKKCTFPPHSHTHTHTPFYLSQGFRRRKDQPVSRKEEQRGLPQLITL